MQQEIEFIAYRKLKHVNIFVDAIAYRNKHLHRDIELCLVLQGNATFETNEKAFLLRPYEMLLLNTNDAHSIQSKSGEMLGLFFQVSTHFIRDYAPILRNEVFDSVKIDEFLSQEEAASLRKDLFEAAKAYLGADPYFEMTVISKICSVFALLLRHIPHHTVSEVEIQRNKFAAERIAHVVSYVDENLAYPIRLKDIAAKEGITTTHLSHVFSSHFGMTFQEYVSLRRLEEAVRLVARGNMTMLAISEAAGFSDQKYMTKMFLKQFGCHPREFSADAAKLVLSTSGRSPMEHIYLEDEALRLLRQFEDVFEK